MKSIPKDKVHLRTRGNVETMITLNVKAIALNQRIRGKLGLSVKGSLGLSDFVLYSVIINSIFPIIFLLRYTINSGYRPTVANIR